MHHVTEHSSEAHAPGLDEAGGSTHVKVNGRAKVRRRQRQRSGSMDKKVIVLVAHDAKKIELLNWVKYNAHILRNHILYATGTTGGLINRECPELNVIRLRSGPLGGDQQVGAMIAENRVDFLVFFTDPMTTQPHDVDVKALTRLSVLYNLPMACNKATADYVISSPLVFDPGYKREVPSYSTYVERDMKRNEDDKVPA
jgi:methylglyoxal synthase